MKNNSIGKKLYARRKELSLTQKQIADYVGVTEATVSRWESGEIDNMRRDKIANLARVLKVSPLLIMGITEEEAHTGSKKIVSNTDETKLVESYRELNDDDKNFVLGMIGRLSFSRTPAEIKAAI